MPNAEDPKARAVAFLQQRLNADDLQALAKLLSDVGDASELAVALAETGGSITSSPMAGDSLARRFPGTARIGIQGPDGDRRRA